MIKYFYWTKSNEVPRQNQIHVIGIPINTMKVSIVSLLNLSVKSKSQDKLADT